MLLVGILFEITETAFASFTGGGASRGPELRDFDVKITLPGGESFLGGRQDPDRSSANAVEPGQSFTSMASLDARSRLLLRRIAVEGGTPDLAFEFRSRYADDTGANLPADVFISAMLLWICWSS